MRLLVGDDTSVTQATRYRDGIKSLSKRFKSPSNAVALAAVNALFQPNDAATGMASGLSSTVATRFLLPHGILPRMGLLACGWIKPGDEFKRATDRSWFAKKYAHPLWEPLETYAAFLDAAALGPGSVAFDDRLAAGDSGLISNRIASSEDDLTAIRANGSDVCAPYFIPARVGVLPVSNLACQTRLNIKPITDDTDRRAREIFGAPIPWWVWVSLAFVASKYVSRSK